MKTPIDLGQKRPSGCCVPSAISSSEGQEKVYYPELYIDDLPDDLPDQGTMTVRFIKARETHFKEGKCSCNLEILEILDSKADAAEEKSDKYAESADTLDKLKDEVTKKD